jgi:hypothetical protein
MLKTLGASTRIVCAGTLEHSASLDDQLKANDGALYLLAGIYNSQSSKGRAKNCVQRSEVLSYAGFVVLLLTFPVNFVSLNDGEKADEFSFTSTQLLQYAQVNLLIPRRVR